MLSGYRPVRLTKLQPQHNHSTAAKIWKEVRNQLVRLRISEEEVTIEA